MRIGSALGCVTNGKDDTVNVRWKIYQFGGRAPEQTVTTVRRASGCRACHEGIGGKNRRCTCKYGRSIRAVPQGMPAAVGRLRSVKSSDSKTVVSQRRRKARRSCRAGEHIKRFAQEASDSRFANAEGHDASSVICKWAEHAAGDNGNVAPDGDYRFAGDPSPFQCRNQWGTVVSVVNSKAEAERFVQ